MDSNVNVDDLGEILLLLSKHLKNLSGRISEEENDLTNYDSHLQKENFNSKLKNKEESLINLAQEMLTIQSKMISNISNRRTKIKKDAADIDLDLYYGGPLFGPNIYG